jgi:hypothetical protein
MGENPSDFGTGLRAHLGLEHEQLDVAAEPFELPEPIAETHVAADLAELPEPVAEHVPAGIEPLETLATLQAQLLERERALVEREAILAGRAGSLLAATQALYDEVLRGSSPAQDDELARLRQRKTVA